MDMTQEEKDALLSEIQRAKTNMEEAFSKLSEAQQTLVILEEKLEAVQIMEINLNPKTLQEEMIKFNELRQNRDYSKTEQV